MQILNHDWFVSLAVAPEPHRHGFLFDDVHLAHVLSGAAHEAPSAAESYLLLLNGGRTKEFELLTFDCPTDLVVLLCFLRYEVCLNLAEVIDLVLQVQLVLLLGIQSLA